MVVLAGILEFAGVTVTEVTVALVTVSTAVPVTEPEAAVIVAVPVPTVVAKPAELMVATEEEEEDHATDGNSCVLPSSKLPVALNCWLVPTAMETGAGLTEMETRWAGTTVSRVVSVNEPTCAVIVAAPALKVVAKPELLMEATPDADELQVTPLTRSWVEPSL